MKTLFKHFSALISSGIGPHLVYSIIALSPLLQISSGRCDEKQEQPSRDAFSQDYNTVEARAIEQQMLKDLDALSIGKVSRFHRHLVEKLGSVLPRDVDVKYEGPLALESAHPSQKILDQGFTGALSWTVEGNIGIFSFWISTVRTNSTVAVTQADDTTIYINLSHIDQDESWDKPLKALGDRSVRETLKLLEEQQKLPKSESKSQARPVIKQEDGKQNHEEAAKMEGFHRLIDLIRQENLKHNQT